MFAFHNTALFLNPIEVKDVGDVEVVKSGHNQWVGEKKIKCKEVCTISLTRTHTHSNQNKVLATVFDELFSNCKAH